jgi:hypothetical protein
LIRISDFDVDDVLPIEASALVHQATSNELLTADDERELMTLAPNRAIAALAYAHYSYESVMDEEQASRVIENLKRHLDNGSPSIVAAIALMIADVDEWLWGMSSLSSDAIRGTLALDMLELSTGLRPDWVTNWLYLCGLREEQKDWQGALACVERLVDRPVFGRAALDPVSEAFEVLFTGRVTWTPARAAELSKSVARRMRRSVLSSLVRRLRPQR